MCFVLSVVTFVPVNDILGSLLADLASISFSDQSAPCIPAFMVPRYVFVFDSVFSCQFSLAIPSMVSIAYLEFLVCCYAVAVYDAQSERASILTFDGFSIALQVLKWCVAYGALVLYFRFNPRLVEKTELFVPVYWSFGVGVPIPCPYGYFVGGA